MKEMARKIGLTTGVFLLAGGVVPTTGMMGNTWSVTEVQAADVKYQTASNLNLRSGASTKNKVLLTIPKGKSVSQISTKGGWTQVSYGGKKGWVASKYLKKVTPVQKSKTVNLLTTENLNLRATATTTSKVVTTIPKGKTVVEQSRKGTWSFVKYGTKSGWVANKYLTTVKTVAKPIVPPPSVTPPENPNSSFSTSTTLYTTKENLNLRAGTGTNHPVLFTIPKGETVECLSEKNGWAQVRYQNTTGYVNKSYLLVKETKKMTRTFTAYPITLSQMVEKQFSLNAQTDKYRNAPAYVSKKLVTVTDKKGTITDTTNVRSETNTTSHIYGTLKKGTIVNIVGESNDFYQVQFSPWRNAIKEDIVPMVDPTSVNPDSKENFQFLDLSKSAGVTAQSMNKVLEGRGVLAGKGSAFIEASKMHHVNEIYLASHAMLETGHGTSQLSSGVLVSEVDGKPVEPKVVYNMYGIGAVDSAPLKGGSETAYKNGWFTPESAIIGGAKFIGEKYVNHPTYKQNTLYKMRWNPATPGTHQYATDIGWAVKQVSSIYNLYQILDDYTLSFDIPVYSK
ncbi:mannosyl-glycoprotein endo-beta-N-acetylglucosamidase (plasmid) [Jeotgalibacillus malaysiensis]|uniref:Mannosyl-glycoprotein endo-beta-N-acetylglucosamidase n=1 Tax=Jeotgalibacillus malaysiensis TaxID=1508404 RepID=A0A0B5B0C7_9BACL|nr:mannosyl-glycoprotein endo-beta-N-acetylglucosamidase [Jeotgalibacillus malaysiensis]